MTNPDQTKITSNTIGQSVANPADGHPVVHSSGALVGLAHESEASSAVRKFGARGSIVWLFLAKDDGGEVDATRNHHVLVNAVGGEEAAATTTAAIETLTLARDQLVRLQQA